VRSGKVTFTPPRWEKTYFEWMENIRDWCISRQIWWGHRIPVYTCADCAHEWAVKATPAACPVCRKSDITQDPDVLDTWFSSWLWPFSTFGWPHENPDLNCYYPTNDLATAPEIIFFWVARMMMAGYKFMGDVPFRHVYIHGTVRDAQGRKMSKSLGNSLDPLDIIGQYSADALRFSLMLITSTGMDVYVDMSKFEIGRNFATKIWNAARFMKMNREKAGFTARQDGTELTLDPALLRDIDRHLLHLLNETIEADPQSAKESDKKLVSVNQSLEDFNFQAAALLIYSFAWTAICDWYLESVKQDLNGTDHALRAHVLSILDDVFSKTLKLLHPYMPFITEELWHEMGYGAPQETIMKAAWPQRYSDEQVNAWGLCEATTDFVNEMYEKLIADGRALRVEYNVPPSTFVRYVIQATDDATLKRLVANEDILKRQLRAETIEFTCDTAEHAMPGKLGKLGTIYLLLDGLVDVQAEAARVKAELAKEQGFLNNVNAKLSNEGFVSKAPPAVIEQQRARQRELAETIARLEVLLSSFGG